MYEPSCGGAFRQTEVLSSVTQLIRTLAGQGGESTPVDLVHHPFAIVVSQDCDLDLDYSARRGLTGPNGKTVGSEKKIPNILLCELFTAEGLLQSGRDSGELHPGLWTRIKSNTDIRYQFFQLAEAEFDAAEVGLPEMAVDFKRYFSIRSDDLYDQLERSAHPDHGQIQRRLRLKSPYCEHFCTRFGFYLSRIALPSPHVST